MSIERSFPSRVDAARPARYTWVRMTDASLALPSWVSAAAKLPLGFAQVREDPAIDLAQTWLDCYELEPYLLFKAVRQGYRVIEVPVSKLYPSKSLGYTKMRPITGWWSILRPLLLLPLGIRQ